MSNRMKYKIFLYVLFFAGVTGLLFFSIHVFSSQIPDKIILNKNQQNIIDLSVPFTGDINSSQGTAANTPSDDALSEEYVKAGGNYITSINFNSPVTIKTGDEASYQVKLKLFGIFDFKDITMDVVSDRYIYACGIPVGMYLKTEGVLVIDLAEFVAEGGESVSPCNNILRKGDCILKVDGNSIKTKDELIEKINSCDGAQVILTVKRNDNEFDVKVQPYKDSTGAYKIGIWVRDDAQGIGTMTFVDEKNRFGALGHGISDVDTGEVFNVENGVLYRANILTVVKGQAGMPGEYIGTIDYSSKNQLGSILENSNCGVYGYVTEDFNSYKKLFTKYKVGYRFDMELGKAYILSGTDEKIKKYEINIDSLDYSTNNINKGIEFTVTDPELLQKTNGIVQGMSGSPIIQNDRIVGAVTHVFINDPAKGYGIFIEEMLKE